MPGFQRVGEQLPHWAEQRPPCLAMHLIAWCWAALPEEAEAVAAAAMSHAWSGEQRWD